MTGTSMLRNVLVVATGAIIYYALLSWMYSAAPYVTPPQWKLLQVLPKPAAIVLWFALINLAGALLSAIPVGIAQVLLARTHRSTRSLLIGIVVASVAVIGGLGQYGFPRRAVPLVVDALQFLSIAGAVFAVVAMLNLLPSNKALERSRDG